MTSSALARSFAAPRRLTHVIGTRTAPILVVAIGIVVIWYVGAVLMNASLQIDQFERQKVDWTMAQLIEGTLSQTRPLVPSPGQILADMQRSILDQPVTSRRSLVHHAWVTLSATLLGFAIGTIFGIILAMGIVHARSLDKSLMPWIVSSQMVPILAIAPMVIVVLASIGLRGLIPKAIISAYLCFFPVAIGMVKGLRSPDTLRMDLMRTYNASAWQTLWLLRWPAATPFLFASLKVAIAIGLVGAIVGELPTGASAGLGARLLVGSYYGQTVQMWSALITASILAASLVMLIGLIERLVARAMGAPP